MKTTRQLEKVIKGFSNHRRIEILAILARTPDLSLLDITQEIGVNFRTASEHLRRLVIAGLVTKKNEGRIVRHSLSRQGRFILKFLGMLE